MSKKILLTSFATWLPHQASNSSDDLLVKLLEQDTADLIFLRQLPVDIAQASQRVVNAIEHTQPDRIICCGMAESRYQLTIESNATWTNDKINTTVNLEQLIENLTKTAISHNAGKFVCEGLYYQVLNYLQQSCPKLHCIFVHVPVLNLSNFSDILGNFGTMLGKLGWR